MLLILTLSSFFFCSLWSHEDKWLAWCQILACRVYSTELGHCSNPIMCYPLLQAGPLPLRLEFLPSTQTSPIPDSARRLSRHLCIPSTTSGRNKRPRSPLVCSFYLYCVALARWCGGLSDFALINLLHKITLTFLSCLQLQHRGVSPIQSFGRSKTTKPTEAESATPQEATQPVGRAALGRPLPQFYGESSRLEPTGGSAAHWNSAEPSLELAPV